MGRFIEFLQTISAFSKSFFKPVYIIDNVKNKGKFYVKNKIRSNNPNKNLTAISWNILRNYNKEKIKKSLKSLIGANNPDLILIQESPVYNNSAFWQNSLFKGYNICYSPLHQVKNQNYFYNFLHSGQLILSKYKFLKSEVYNFPTVTNPVLGVGHLIKRIALYCRIKNNNKNLGIYNLHLENACGPIGRKQQIEYLIKIINKNKDDVVIIGGDFNTLLGYFENCIKELEKADFQNLFNKFEFRLIPRLDYFLVKGSKAIGIEVKGNGSDHKPVMIKLN